MLRTYRVVVQFVHPDGHVSMLDDVERQFDEDAGIGSGDGDEIGDRVREIVERDLADETVAT